MLILKQYKKSKKRHAHYISVAEALGLLDEPKPTSVWIGDSDDGRFVSDFDLVSSVGIIPLFRSSGRSIHGVILMRKDGYLLPVHEERLRISKQIFIGSAFIAAQQLTNEISFSDGTRGVLVRWFGRYEWVSKSDIHKEVGFGTPRIIQSASVTEVVVPRRSLIIHLKRVYSVIRDQMQNWQSVHWMKHLLLGDSDYVYDIISSSVVKYKVSNNRTECLKNDALHDRCKELIGVNIIFDKLRGILPGRISELGGDGKDPMVDIQSLVGRIHLSHYKNKRMYTKRRRQEMNSKREKKRISKQCSKCEVRKAYRAGGLCNSCYSPSSESRRCYVCGLRFARQDGGRCFHCIVMDPTNTSFKKVSNASKQIACDGCGEIGSTSTSTYTCDLCKRNRKCISCVLRIGDRVGQLCKVCREDFKLLMSS